MTASKYISSLRAQYYFCPRSCLPWGLHASDNVKGKGISLLELGSSPIQLQLNGIWVRSKAKKQILTDISTMSVPTQGFERFVRYNRVVRTGGPLVATGVRRILPLRRERTRTQRVDVYLFIPSNGVEFRLCSIFDACHSGGSLQHCQTPCLSGELYRIKGL